MARFDVYRARDSDDLVLDCQADILADLPTRFMVPLIPVDRFGMIYSRLNPVFRVEGADYMMATQMTAAVPVKSLAGCLVSLADEHSHIRDALDMLLTGY
jgi:toxin CcdB